MTRSTRASSKVALSHAGYLKRLKKSLYKTEIKLAQEKRTENRPDVCSKLEKKVGWLNERITLVKRYQF